MTDFEHRDLGPGRAYRVTKSAELVAFHVEAAFPHAPEGFWLYAFVEKGRRVGRWDWARDEAGLLGIMEAYRTATDPRHVPPEWRNADGREPDVRPPDRDLVARAMDAARPGPPAPDFRHLRLVPDDEQA